MCGLGEGAGRAAAPALPAAHRRYSSRAFPHTGDAFNPSLSQTQGNLATFGTEAWVEAVSARRGPGHQEKEHANKLLSLLLATLCYGPWGFLYVLHCEHGDLITSVSRNLFFAFPQLWIRLQSNLITATFLFWTVAMLEESKPSSH